MLQRPGDHGDVPSFPEKQLYTCLIRFNSVICHYCIESSLGSVCHNHPRPHC